MTRKVDYDHPLQSIMSRTGSFPLKVACRLLQENCTKSSVIFDPFCGKGTALLAARILGHNAWGMDVAPEAVACSLAKLVDVSLDDVKYYIEALPLNGSLQTRMPSYIKPFFHPSTLAQTLSIRDELLKQTKRGTRKDHPNAIFVLATLLGILHGHSSFSLSIPSRTEGRIFIFDIYRQLRVHLSKVKIGPIAVRSPSQVGKACRPH